MQHRRQLSTPRSLNILFDLFTFALISTSRFRDSIEVDIGRISPSSTLPASNHGTKIRAAGEHGFAALMHLFSKVARRDARRSRWTTTSAGSDSGAGALVAFPCHGLKFQEKSSSFHRFGRIVYSPTQKGYQVTNMSSGLAPLAMSQTKDELLKHLNMSPETYAEMAVRVIPSSTNSPFQLPPHRDKVLSSQKTRGRESMEVLTDIFAVFRNMLIMYTIG